MCGPASRRRTSAVITANSVHGSRAADAVRGSLPAICAPARWPKPKKPAPPWAEVVECRLGSGLSVLAPEEATEIIIAGMGAETILEILDAAPWVRDARYNLILVPGHQAQSAAAGAWPGEDSRWQGRPSARRRDGGTRWSNARFSGQASTPGCLVLPHRPHNGPAGLFRLSGPAAAQGGKVPAAALAPGPEADAVDALIRKIQQMV